MPKGFQIKLIHAAFPANDCGLYRNRVVGLITADVFSTEEEATTAMNNWLHGRDGQRAALWTATVIPRVETPRRRDADNFTLADGEPPTDAVDR